MGKDVVSINGKVVNANEASVSVMDHCFLYGDGVFEGIRVIKRKILLHGEHLERLYRSASLLKIPMPPMDEFEKELFDAIKASEYEDCYLRVVISRGNGSLGIDPRKCAEITRVIIVSFFTIYPESLYRVGIKVAIAKTRRIPIESFDCSIKSCNYLTNVMAMTEGIEKNYHDALMLTLDGFVSEATVANVFGIKGKELFTPSLVTNCLPGTTRKKIMEIGVEKGLSVKEGLYKPSDFKSADEVFLTGTGAGMMPVTTIDDSIIGNGEMGTITEMLRATYESRLESFSTPIP